MIKHYSFRTAVRFSTIGAFLIPLLGGCASTKYGNKMDPDSVARIQNGATTRTQVEEMLGPPTNVSMMPDGRRMLSYTYSETKAHATPITYVPFVGSFAGGAKSKSRTQTLQVMVSKDGVVEDHQFNDNATSGEYGSGLLNGGHTSTVTPTTPKD